MGPKPDPKDAMKKEVVVDGKNLAAMNDEQVLDFQKQFTERLNAVQKDNALLEVELNMLRNAWKMTEDKVSEVELENVMIRRELDLVRETMDLTQWNHKEGEFDKRVMYDEIKGNLDKLDEGSDDVIQLDAEESSTTEDAEEFYSSKPSDEDVRFKADKRHIQVNRRLKAKKGKFDAKVNDLRKIKKELEEAISGDQDPNGQGSAASAVPVSSTTTSAPSTAKTVEESTTAPLTVEKTLEDLAYEKGSISTGSVSDKSEHSVIDVPNIIDDALAGLPTSKRKPLDMEQKVIKSLTLLKERKWKRGDMRYDDAAECDFNSKPDSDEDHMFDDFNPFLEEDVDDAVNYYQMRKWLEYDYDMLVEEMKKKMGTRIKAINYVWTKDVKNVLCDELHAIEKYDIKLRDTVTAKIEKEMERTHRNEEHLKLLIQGLEVARIKMIRERYATNMCIAKQQTEELNYLIQESYDRTINELKASAKFNFNLTQIFFMRSAENDISLVHELHSEQKRVEDHVKLLKADVESAKRELSKLTGPLEEEERMAKWMETTIAALQKDMRSKKDQERTNTHLSRDIENVESSTEKMKLANTQIANQLRCLDKNYNEIGIFRDKHAVDNAFNRRLRNMRNVNELRIKNLKNKLRYDYYVNEHHLHLIRQKVIKNVEMCKRKRGHNLLETKAFNELVTQFDLRAREHQMKAYVGIDKLAIPYRKTSANIITTFDDRKKVVFPYKESANRKK